MLSEPISDKFVKKIFEPISKIFDTVKILVSVWVSVLVLSQSRNFVFLDGIGTGVEKKLGLVNLPRTPNNTSKSKHLKDRSGLSVSQ